MASSLALLIFLSMSVYVLSGSLRVNLNGSTYMTHHTNSDLMATSNSEYRVPTVPSHTNFLAPPVQTLERGTLTDAPLPEGNLLKISRVNYIEGNDNEDHDQTGTEDTADPEDFTEDETKEFAVQESPSNFGEVSYEVKPIVKHLAAEFRNERNFFVVPKGNIWDLLAYACTPPTTVWKNLGSSQYPIYVRSLQFTTERCPKFRQCKPVEYSVRILRKMAVDEAILNSQRGNPEVKSENATVNVTCECHNTVT